MGVVIRRRFGHFAARSTRAFKLFAFGLLQWESGGISSLSLSWLLVVDLSGKKKSVQRNIVRPSAYK
jgi:hypothetical protein